MFLTDLFFVFLSKQGAFRSSHGEFLIRPTETTENADQANGFPSEHMAYKIPGEGNDRGHNISIDGVDYSGINSFIESMII